MGETVTIRGIEFNPDDEMDALAIEMFRRGDPDYIFGYESVLLGRRVRNRNPKWRRLDKNTWVKWTGKYAAHVDYPSLVVPVLLCLRRERNGHYQAGFCGGDWFVKGWHISGWNRADARYFATTDCLGVPDGWEVLP